MEEKANHLALENIIPQKRPFMISRSTFPSAGRWTGHWVCFSCRELVFDILLTCASKLGDNYSLWAYLRYSIAVSRKTNLFSRSLIGVMVSRSIIRVFSNFKCFRSLLSVQTHVVLVRIYFPNCDLNFNYLIRSRLGGNTDEELCNRWMSLSAFTPFFRNHNQRGAISQEPYRWDSVANTSRIAISIRYSLLPYWVSNKVFTSFRKH